MKRWRNCRRVHGGSAGHAVRILAIRRLTGMGPPDAVHRVADELVRQATELPTSELVPLAGEGLTVLVEELVCRVLRRRAADQTCWDTELVAACLLGGDAAIDLCRLVRKTTHAACVSLTPADRDGVYGRVLVKLLDDRGKRLLALRQPGRLPGYVRALVRNERSLRRRASTCVELREPRVLEWTAAREHEGLDPGVIREALREFLEERGESCTPLQSRVLRLRLEGQPWTSVAMETGRTKSTVKDAYRRGVERLRRAIHDADDRPLPPL